MIASANVTTGGLAPPTLPKHHENYFCTLSAQNIQTYCQTT
jgi:hypothetical protein